MGAKRFIAGLSLGFVGGIIALMASIIMIPILLLLVLFILMTVFALLFGIVGAVLNTIGAPTIGTDFIGFATFIIDLTAAIAIMGMGVFSFLFGALYNVSSGFIATLINFGDGIINVFLLQPIGLARVTSINPYTGAQTLGGLPTNVHFDPIDTTGLQAGFQSLVNSIISTLRQLGLIQACPTGQTCTA